MRTAAKRDKSKADTNMSSPARYRVNSPNVVHQTFADEVVILDLARGLYYSLTGVGVDIWAMLAGGADAENVIRALHEQFREENGAVETAVVQLIDELQREDLISPGDRSGEGSVPPAVRKIARFAQPALVKYTDMQDLLLLDPIHQNDGAGWPPANG